MQNAIQFQTICKTQIKTKTKQKLIQVFLKPKLSTCTCRPTVLYIYYMSNRSILLLLIVATKEFQPVEDLILLF